MVGLAPRALRDCAPSALSAVLGRPLNFTVRLLVKRLLLLGAVVTFVASVNAEPPPRLPFESVDWPASLKHEPSKGVTLGALRVTFETTTLSEVHKAASTGAIAHGGKGGDSMSWLCYSIPRSDGVDRVWFISHGEMGGPERSVTAFAATRLENVPVSAECPALPAKLQPLTLDRHIWLGNSDAQLHRYLGSPSHEGASWRAYKFQTKVKGNCEGGFDMLNWLFTKSAQGHVTSLYAGQVTSC